MKIEICDNMFAFKTYFRSQATIFMKKIFPSLLCLAVAASYSDNTLNNSTTLNDNGHVVLAIHPDETHYMFRSVLGPCEEGNCSLISYAAFASIFPIAAIVLLILLS